MRIGLDFDDTIADALGLKRSWISQKFSIPLDQPIDTKDPKYKESKNEMYRDREFTLEYLKPRVGSLEAISQLVRSHDLSIVTSRSGDVLGIARDWLNINGVENLEVNGVGYGNSKLDACRELDIFVDDELRKLVNLVGSVKHLFIITTEENKDEQLPEGIKRIDSLEDLIVFISILEG